MANDITYNSFFSEMTTDNNGIAVTDINVGLNNLYGFFNETADSLVEVQNYLVSEHEEDYPDLVALHSVLGSTQYWWWLLLLNRLEDPLVDIKSNYVYSINSQEQINSFIEESSATNSAAADTRIGTIVELN